MIAERKGATGRIVLECHEPLMSLLAEYPGVDAMIERFAPPPPADLQLPLLSAARVLGVDSLEKLPRDVPYLPVPAGPDLPVPEATPDRLNVGLVLVGNTPIPPAQRPSPRLGLWLQLFERDALPFFTNTESRCVGK